MRKSRIVLIIACLLATVMLLSSCGGAASTIKFTKIIDGSLYTDTNPAYDAALKVDDLQDAEKQSERGDLLLFRDLVETSGSSREKWMVYNLASNKVVYTATESDVYNVTVSLEGDYYIIRTTTYAKSNDVVDYSNYEQKTILYNAEGAEIASADYYASYNEMGSLLRFDGKIYSISDEGAIAFVADIPGYSALPDIFAETEDYYYGSIDDGTVVVLDKELKIVSTYTLPSYIDVNAFAVLENNKVLLQGSIELDAYADKYDYLKDGKKYDLYTVLINGKNAKVKEIDLEYVIHDCEEYDAEDRKESGFNDKVKNVAYVYPIENQRINESVEKMAIISDNGKLQILKPIDGFDVSYVSLVATNRWAVQTEQDYMFLLDEKGDVIGEISNVNDANKSYIVADGKLYDFSLSMVLDYRKEGLTLVETLPDSILFTNKKDELIVYANGTKTTLIAEDAEREYVDSMSEAYRGYFVIVDETNTDAVKYEIYNAKGAKILTLDGGSHFNIFCIAANREGEALIRVTGWDATALEYTYTYYHLG